MSSKLKTKRMEKKLSVYKLSEKTGLSPSYISNLENNRRDNPSKDAMNKIAVALESSVIDLFF